MSSGSTKIISVVDDDPDIRRLLDNLLSRHGFVAQMYSDGAQFLAEYDPKESSCVLLDVQLPQLSGLDIAHELQSMQPEPRVILMSAYPQNDDFLAAVDKGLIRYLQKPFDEAELLALL